MAVECTRCGACCVAPDIAALDKPLGARCAHLGLDLLCRVYDDRPLVCRSYAPDDLCRRVEAATLDERVRLYLAAFGLEDEAREVARRRASTMSAARRLPIVGS
jgi:Fe-S-cluster containining protein